MPSTLCPQRRKSETTPVQELAEVAWVRKGEPGAEAVGRFVQAIYLERYGARIALPAGPFLVLRDPHGGVRAALALRRGQAPFFLEHYLDAPVETVLPGTGAARETIVEVGSLAADITGGARALVVTLTSFLAACGIQWVVFTARRELRNTFARLGIELHALAPAQAERLPGGGRDWGTYYAGDGAPQVMAGAVPQGAMAVRKAVGDVSAPLLALWLRGLALGCGVGAQNLRQGTQCPR